MKTILITGANGFVGRNLALRLSSREGFEVLQFNRSHSLADLSDLVAKADVIFHIAGVNRPEDQTEFQTGNVDLTKSLCEAVKSAGTKPHIVFSSSIQAARENPYGDSKRRAEDELKALAKSSDATVSIFRVKNIFGRWSRPNYNSVVSTFCHNIAHDEPIQVNDPEASLELVHVDDVIDAFFNEVETPTTDTTNQLVVDSMPSSKIKLGALADRIREFRAMQTSLKVPDLSNPFNFQLYSTYLSYLDPPNWEYGLHIRSDDRGSLAEFIKSETFGQIFVSRTHPGITRGNHYHHVKSEKFVVLEGEGLIRFRKFDSDEIIEYHVKGEDYRVVDIPPGYTHSITNVGDTVMVTLFWASEIFDPERMDTYFVPVDQEPKQ